MLIAGWVAALPIPFLLIYAPRWPWVAAEYTLRPEPFYFLAAVVVVGLLIAIFLIEETLPYARAEAEREAGRASAEGADRTNERRDAHEDADLPFAEIVRLATYEDRTLLAAAQAGHVENFVDTLAWIGVPLFLADRGLGPGQIGVVVAVHSGAYFLQLFTDRLGDRIGRKPAISSPSRRPSTGRLLQWRYQD